MMKLINEPIFVLIDTFYHDEDHIIKSYKDRGYNKIMIWYQTNFWRDYDALRSGFAYRGRNGIIYPFKFAA